MQKTKQVSNSWLFPGVDPSKIPLSQIETIARIAHEINTSYCISHDDFSHFSWRRTPQEIQDCVMDGVLFHLSNKNAIPGLSHENWLRKKRKQGWVYGKRKNIFRKTHPCMLPFNDLPEQQRAKDYIFRRIVHSVGELILVL